MAVAYLNGPGRNPLLAQGIVTYARYSVGPIEVPLTRLQRIAGPERGMLYPANANLWESTVNKFVEALEAGVIFPPLIAVDFVVLGLAVGDGNKRHAALERLGLTEYLTILCLKSDPRVYNLPTCS